MSITVKIAATTDAVSPGAGNEFTVAGPFTFLGDDFIVSEKASLLRLGPSGEYRYATNKDGRITVSAYPNTVFVEAGGTFRIEKDATKIAASVGYEEA